MTSIHSKLAARLRQLSDTQLRTIYAMIAIVALTASAVYIAALRPQFSISKSDDCFWEGAAAPNGDSIIVVAVVVPGGNADKAGVKKGDRVLAINGTMIPDADLGRAQELLNAAPTDRKIPYVVERNGEILNLQIEVTKQYPFLVLVLPVFSLLWLMIGSMVIFAQPRGSVQRLFFLTAASVVFAFSGFPWLMADSPVSVYLLSLVWLVIGTLFYPLWLSFCTIFPVNHKVFATPLRRLLLFAPLLLILAGPIYRIAVAFKLIDGIEIRGVRLGQLLAILDYAFSVLYFAAGVFFLYRGYRRLPANADRRPVAVIVIGSVVAALVFLYLIVVQTSTNALLNPEIVLPVLLFLALPFSFGYAIFKYQVMDFRLVVKTTLVYTVTMAMIAGLYVALGYGVGQALGALLTEDLRAPVGVVIFVLFVMLFEPVKRQVQIAIENRFFPQQRDYSAQLASYSSEIAEVVGTRAVADLTARTLKSSLDLRGVLVLLEDDHKGGELKAIARDGDLDTAETNAAAGDTTDVAPETITRLRQLLRQSHSLISLETIDDPALTNLQERFSYAIGLYAQGRVIGAVLLSRPVDGEPLSGSQTPFITGVAAQGASAIEVARLYEAELARQRYQEELATARRIQESLLPARMPSFPGISISAVARPAQAVGGDYYEVIQLDEHRFMVMIADVSGKGLPASLYMAELHGMVRIASAISGSPKEILSTLNNHLCQVIERGSFITATILLFDTQRKIVSYARAGHTPIIRRSSAKVDTLIPTGLPLGVRSPLFDSYLQQYTVQYEAGETFILYSDGVSEAMNMQREEFGDGRLFDVIAATADGGADVLCQGILSRVETFRAGAEQNDDVTIVIIRIEKEVAASATAPPQMLELRGL